MATNSDYTNLVKNAALHLPGAMPDVIALELQSLMNDMFDDSNMWVDEIAVAVLAGVTDYEVTSDNGTINRLMNVVDSGNRPIAAELVTPRNDSDSYLVRLRQTPATAAALTANIALVPDNNQSIDAAVPGWVWSRYRVGIMDGIIGRMMAQPSKPYTNLALAAAHGKLFRSTVAQARLEILHRYTFRGQGWSFPRSFATRR